MIFLQRSLVNPIQNPFEVRIHTLFLQAGLAVQHVSRFVTEVIGACVWKFLTVCTDSEFFWKNIECKKGFRGFTFFCDRNNRHFLTGILIHIAENNSSVCRVGLAVPLMGSRIITFIFGNLDGWNNGPIDYRVGKNRIFTEGLSGIFVKDGQPGL